MKFLILILTFSLATLAQAADDPSIQGKTRQGVQAAMQHHIDQNTLEERYVIFDGQTGRLNRLDFALLPSDPTIRGTYTLLGGRYCSVQGALAAQLKVKNKKTGDVLTLYVTRLTKPLKSIASQTTTHDNVTIRLWIDNDRLFGLAGQAK